MSAARKRPGHNEGTIVRALGRPPGAFSIVPDAIFFDTQLSEKARFVLAYFAGRPSGWVVTVSNLIQALGLSQSAWKRVRDELRDKKIVPHDHPKRFGGGRNFFTWQLDIDLSKYWLGQELSTEPSTVSDDGSHRPFSIDGKRSITNTNLSIQKPPRARARGGAPAPQALAGGGEEIGHQDLLELGRGLGLAEAPAQRFARAASGVGGEQLALLSGQLPTALANARNQAALAVHLAKLAAQGCLTPSGPAAAAPTPEAQALGRLEILAGRSLLEPGAGGRRWLVEVGGMVRGGDGLLQPPKVAAALVARLDGGELDLE